MIRKVSLKLMRIRFIAFIVLWYSIQSLILIFMVFLEV
ncbi:unnamed protein product [Dracunculus medinensis]|uniref:Uncharacterized protein n=1 Tax=Dracunculus medinensis TaxID=318479 RepID=A0A3P7TBX2_DRAME|nr:unnamed protein product [Dracunculus medinensis]